MKILSALMGSSDRRTRAMPFRRAVERAAVLLAVVMLAACSQPAAQPPTDPGKAVRDMTGPCEFFTAAERATSQLEAPLATDQVADIRTCVYLSQVIQSGDRYVSQATVSFWGDTTAKTVVAILATPVLPSDKRHPFARTDIHDGYYYYRRDRDSSAYQSCQLVFAVDDTSSVEVEIEVRGGLRITEPVCPVVLALTPFIEGKIPRPPVG